MRRLRWTPAREADAGNQLRLDGEEDELEGAPPAILHSPAARARRLALDVRIEERTAERAAASRELERVEELRRISAELAGSDVVAVVNGRRGRRMRELGVRAHSSIERAELEAAELARRGEYVDECGRELDEKSARKHARRRRAQWWHGRRRGFLERPPDCAKCGAEVLVLRCEAVEGDELCGTRESFRRRCDQRILCPKCAMRRQARDARVHMEAVTRLHRSLEGEKHRHQLSWKLLTVTVEPGPDLHARFAKLRAGVKRLRRLLREEYIPRYSNENHRHPCPVGGLAWFKGAMLVSYEVTEGTARAGHPHAHLLILAPFITPAWLRGDPDDDDDGGALERCGLGPVADIRAIRAKHEDSAGARKLRRNGVQVDAVIHCALREVLKYSVKPLAGGWMMYVDDGDGGKRRRFVPRRYADDDARARVLQRLDALLYGRRTVERCGLLRAEGIYLSRAPTCPGCGAVGCRRLEGIWPLEVFDPSAELETSNRATGPPSSASSRATATKSIRSVS